MAAGSIEALTAALEENTAALKAHTAALGGKAAPKGKPAAEDDDKPAAKKTTKKSDAPSVEDVAAAFTDYLKVKDKDVLEARKANVGKINKKFGVKRVTEVDEDDRQAALDMLQSFIDAEGDGDGEDDDGGSMV